jgi:acyl carrier protein
MNDTQNRILRCFVNVFPDLPPAELSNLSVASLARWDSIAHVTLLSAIAEEFSLDISPEDFEELTSYKLIADYVAERISLG